MHMEIWNIDVPLAAKAVAAWLREHHDHYQIAPGLVSIPAEELRSLIGATGLEVLLDALELKSAIQWDKVDDNYVIFVRSKVERSKTAAFYQRCLANNEPNAEPKKGFFDVSEAQKQTSDPPDRGVPEILESIENSVSDPNLESNSWGGDLGGGRASEAPRQPAPEESEVTAKPEADATPTKQSRDLGSQLKRRKKAPRKVEDVKPDPNKQTVKAVQDWIDEFREKFYRDRGMRPRKAKWTPTHDRKIKALFDDGYTLADFMLAWESQAEGDLIETDPKRFRKYFTPETVHRPANFGRNVNAGTTSRSEEIAKSGESREYTDGRAYEADQIGDIS